MFSNIAELKTINRKHSDSDEIGGNTVPRGTSERLQSLISLTKKMPPDLEARVKGGATIRDALLWIYNQSA
ncbi:hypothetical protein NBRC116589_24160 [Ruegeria sp. HU-ET01832]